MNDSAEGILAGNTSKRSKRVLNAFEAENNVSLKGGTNQILVISIK